MVGDQTPYLQTVFVVMENEQIIIFNPKAFKTSANAGRHLNPRLRITVKKTMLPIIHVGKKRLLVTKYTNCITQ